MKTLHKKYKGVFTRPLLHQELLFITYCTVYTMIWENCKFKKIRI